MGRKLPNEPQHEGLKANTAGGREPETQLFQFPGRSLESNKCKEEQQQRNAGDLGMIMENKLEIRFQ